MRHPLAALVALAATLAAQEAPAPEEASDPNVLLSAALRRLHDREEIVARVTVKQEEKPLEAPGGAAGIGNVVIQGGTDRAQPFEGTVEAWRAAGGATVILSARELPGFGLYVADGRTLKEETYEDERPGLDQLQAELAPLLDAARLTRHLIDAKLPAARDEATGGLVFEGDVSKAVVDRIAAEFGGFMAPRVLRAEARVVLAAGGELRRIAIRVAHNDPLREMMQKGLRGVRFAGGGVVVEEVEAEKKHDVETGTTTYALDFTGEGPSERARAFRERMERLLQRGR